MEAAPGKDAALAGRPLITLRGQAATVSEPTLEEVERRLDRATDLETEAAVATLRVARRDLRTLEDDPGVDEERRGHLADRVDQRIREVTERDAYAGELGAAMNPDEEDAP